MTSRSSALSTRLRGFGPLGLLAILLVFAAAVLGPIVAAAAVLLWAWLSDTPMADLGLLRPRSWAVTALVGAPLGIAFKLLMKAVVMPLLGAPAANPQFHDLAGNTSALPGMLAMVVVGGGFGEELFYRGYLFERGGKLFGRGKAALAAAVAVSTLLFSAAHYPGQGLPGAEQAAFTGSVFGAVYAWRRQLGLLMIAHAAFDVAAVALIYWNWEAPIAHLVFR